MGNAPINKLTGADMKVLDFSGSNETLIRMFEHDIIAPELKKLDRSVKVAMIILVEEEPFYVPDSDDIQITKTGEDIRPGVNFGEAVQVVDDLRFGDIVEREQKENWSEADEQRMDIIGSNGNDGEVYGALHGNPDTTASFDVQHGVMEGNGWIAWGGGECPVDDQKIVQGKKRCGTVFDWRFNPSFLDWKHRGDDDDIIEYRIVENTDGRGDDAEVVGQKDRGDPEITCA